MGGLVFLGCIPSTGTAAERLEKTGAAVRRPPEVLDCLNLGLLAVQSRGEETEKGGAGTVD